MRGIVIHHAGGIRRAIEGKTNLNRLSVRPILGITPSRPQKAARPVSFVFYHAGRIIAKSSRVLLMRGRRYPGVEHWFVLPDVAHYALADAQYAIAPIATSSINTL